MRRRIVFSIAGIVCLALVATIAVRTTAAPKPIIDDKALMQKKLAHAQAILEGLSLENFEQIKKNAQELSLISLESQWMSAHSPRYNQLAAEFRMHSEGMAEMAEKGNLEGATLSYVRTVTSCVDCHKVVRGAEVTADAR